MICFLCGAKMKARRIWLFNCPSCGIESSNLKAGSGRGIGGLESLRRHNFSAMMDRIEKHYSLSNKSVLEVGCAEGWFLEEARARGLRVIAIEPSTEHAEIARAKGFKVLDGYFPQSAPSETKFDFVVFNDVFEHLPDPQGAIESCHGLLNPGGALVLNLPSNTGIVYRVASLLDRLGMSSTLDRLWQKDFPSPHLTYFNADTLRRFVTSNTELRHVETLPLDTIVSDGLSERIRASHRGLTGWMLHTILLLALPFVRILPADIIVGIFEKPAERKDDAVLSKA